jgi:hypothetical protein
VEVIQAGDGEDGRRKVLKAVQIIREKAANGQRIGLRELSEEVGLSRWHLLRIFRKRWGVTPKEMADGVLNLDEQNNAGSGTPNTVSGSSTSAESNSLCFPQTPDIDGDTYGGLAGTAFDDAFVDFEWSPVDMDLTVPDLWNDQACAEDLLRDLFPEVYEQGRKT